MFTKDENGISESDVSDDSSDENIFMAFDNQEDQFEEEEEGEVDLEAELVSALCELRKERKECRYLKRNIEDIQCELQKSNDLVKSTEAMLVDLKLKIEEARITEEALNKFLIEKDRE